MRPPGRAHLVQSDRQVAGEGHVRSQALGLGSLWLVQRTQSHLPPLANGLIASTLRAEQSARESLRCEIIGSTEGGTVGRDENA